MELVPIQTTPHHTSALLLLHKSSSTCITVTSLAAAAGLPLQHFLNDLHQSNTVHIVLENYEEFQTLSPIPYIEI
jgi:hypothetical protein